MQAWCNWLATEDLKSSGREIMRVRLPPLALKDIMLYKNAFCDSCKQDSVFSSVWSSDPLKCKNCGHRKIFDAKTYQCRKCNKDVEYDAAICTFSVKQKDGTYGLITEPDSEYCIDCENEIDP